MTTVVLSPLRKQGDVNKIPAAPTAVLLQGSGTPPTATIPRTQGSSTSPKATSACTQGSGTSLPDTLAHSYTPIVHLDPLLAYIKGRSRAFMREGRAGERADEQAHSLSLSLANACNPYYEHTPWCGITRAAFLPCVPSRANPSGLGHAAKNLLVGPGTPGVETPTSSIREKSQRLWNAKGPKNTFPELVAEKRLKFSKHRVVHRSVGADDLAVHLSGAEWSTVQWVRAIWRFTFPPVALYKQTGWCRVTTIFIAIALLCC
jgi:hypothetical protein